ncbi:hypothetical protein [Robbsia andropogonis]|uniref:hypothetical protein n=1 Tax=Robbsia andropogonis TaxID=28092 RepID=UPI002A69E427|nr:hypothetical protein [Robbsia andropogonis]
MSYRMIGLTLALTVGMCPVINAKPLQGIESKCDGTETFVFIPAGVDKYRFLAQYEQEHKGPSDAELERCGLTRDQWRASVLKEH